MLLFVYYPTILNNINISISDKGKTLIFTNDIEAYSKKTLSNKICRLTTTNIQLITNKIKTKKTKINLKPNKI